VQATMQKKGHCGQGPYVQVAAPVNAFKAERELVRLETGA